LDKYTERATVNVLDLFSGIGGFSLGLERAGMRTVAFCEVDPFCRRVLAKHWPDIPCYDDVRSLTAERLAADGIAADVICGGFPCQDISVAGKGAGIEAERSGLWSEYARIIGELRPRYVIVENVAALLGRGLERVLGDLATLGFDAEWHCIPASAIGAPHRRDRVWIVAFPRCGGLAFGERLLTRRQIADAAASAPCQWDDLPDVGRAVHGLSNRVDRLCGLGNAVVPQIPEIIGRAIMKTQCP
jgi:DNA (cytosine-5)-methyltransferase 1